MTRISTRSYGMPAVRPKVRKYKYLYDDNPDLKAIVFDIINGLPVDEIEPELYPSILPFLREKEHALKEWKNQPASRSISNAINHIENYRYCEDPKQIQPRGMRTIHAKTGKLSPTELSIQVDLALRGQFNRIDPRSYNLLANELQNVKREALQNHDYLLAEQAVNASRRVIALNSDNTFAEITAAKVDELADKLSIKETDRDDLKKKWEKRIKDAEKQRDKDLQEIDNQNEVELKQFDLQFQLDPPPDMRKFSPNLLQIRARERYMVQSGRYVEATALRKEANQLEAIESEEHKQRWIKELKLKRDELIKKQKERKFVREMNANNAIEKMRRQSLQEIDHQVKAVQHAESHYEDATVVQSFGTIKKAPSSKSTSTTRCSGASLTSRTSARSKTGMKQPQSNAALFRQRAMINTIIYSRIGQSPRKEKKI